VPLSPTPHERRPSERQRRRAGRESGGWRPGQGRRALWLHCRVSECKRLLTFALASCSCLLTIVTSLPPLQADCQGQPPETAVGQAAAAAAGSRRRSSSSSRGGRRAAFGCCLPACLHAVWRPGRRWTLSFHGPISNGVTPAAAAAAERPPAAAPAARRAAACASGQAVSEAAAPIPHVWLCLYPLSLLFFT
jgi:hypothetical protein